MLASFVRSEPLHLLFLFLFVYVRTTRESSFQHALGVKKKNKYWILYECKIA